MTLSIATIMAAAGITALVGQTVIERPTAIKVFTTRAIAAVLAEIGPDFERTSGHKLIVTSDIAGRLVQQIQAGEPFDFLVASPTHIETLIKEGKIAADTRTPLARSRIGVAVRAGAAKPDISSVETFKRALLNAKSIAYLRVGQSGIYLAEMIERLGLTEALAAKLTRPETDIVSELVAKGEIELGMVVVTQILTTPGVALVGELPRELQSYAVFTAGVSANSAGSHAARQLLHVLTSATASSVMRSQGMEPLADVRR